MTEDEIELEVLKRFVDHHAEADRLDPPASNKCLRELDLRSVLAEVTGKSGAELDHDWRIWSARLVRKGAGDNAKPLRPCTDTSKNQGEHRHHVRAFMLGSAGAPAPAWDRVRELERSGVRARMVTSIRLFISHSSDDVELAERLIDLLRAALHLPDTAIRCTSVDGYRLPAGADTNEQLRTEVHAADAFIGIVSERSLRSLYVVFELGARWGAKKHLIPALRAGTDAGFLVGPLAGLNALRLDASAQLHQLVTDLAEHLKIDPAKPASYEKHIKRVLDLRPTTVQLSPSSRTADFTNARSPFRPNGVNYTGGPWEQPVAEALLREGTPLDAEVVLVPNTAAGTTPGMWIRVTSHEPEPVDGATFVLQDVRWWHERSRRFVKTEDVYQSGAFRPLSLEPRANLFCERPTNLGFVRADERRVLRIVGSRDGGQEDCRLETAGVWQLRGEVVAGERRRAVELCFEWDGKLPPKPSPCPATAQT